MSQLACLVVCYSFWRSCSCSIYCYVVKRQLPQVSGCQPFVWQCLSSVLRTLCYVLDNIKQKEILLRKAVRIKWNDLHNSTWHDSWSTVCAPGRCQSFVSAYLQSSSSSSDRVSAPLANPPLIEVVTWERASVTYEYIFKTFLSTNLHL